MKYFLTLWTYSKEKGFSEDHFNISEKDVPAKVRSLIRKGKQKVKSTPKMTDFSIDIETVKVDAKN